MSLAVRVRDSEPVEVAIKRFRRRVQKAGILSEVRKRSYYDKPSVRRKKKAAAARKRLKKRMKKLGFH